MLNAAMRVLGDPVAEQMLEFVPLLCSRGFLLTSAVVVIFRDERWKAQRRHSPSLWSIWPSGLSGATAHVAAQMRALVRNRSSLEKVGLQLQGVRFDPITGER